MRQYKLYEGKGNDCLTLETVDKPVIKRSTDVIVKIHALSLNARDHQFTNGIYAIPLPEGGAVVTSGTSVTPSSSYLERSTLIPLAVFMRCIDAAGEVVEVGSEVSDFKIGDRVIPIPYSGFHHVSRREKFLSLNNGLTLGVRFHAVRTH
jgi:NADPH:quinone reductase-like Zn-dependent oxidoreductase